jgi:cardiolipin synthase
MKAAFWVPGNRVRLLENGEEYFPRVFEAIAQAQKEVLIETFILFDDPVGRQLQAGVIAAARRGLRVELTVDGYGSADLPLPFIEAITTAGVRFHIFDPRPPVFGVRTNIFRRLHRKLVVIDACRAFIGGINFSEEHLVGSGLQAKQDYAVEVEGPVVRDLHRLAEAAVGPVEGHWRRWWHRWRRQPPTAPTAAHAGGADAALVVRDNERHRDDIERHYRAAIRSAHREVLIANAYFFPGYRLLRALRQAARRGVSVRLILQGRPDMNWARWAALTLYEHLLRARVEIYEYCERPLHGKVAVIDGEWVTVGSSNLDPLSLFLNLEANLVVRDREFAAALRARLERLLSGQCQRVAPGQALRWPLLREGLGLLAFHVVRRFPAWAGWLPAHVPRRQVLPPGSTADLGGD